MDPLQRKFSPNDWDGTQWFDKNKIEAKLHDHIGIPLQIISWYIDALSLALIDWWEHLFAVGENTSQQLFSLTKGYATNTTIRSHLHEELWSAIRDLRINATTKLHKTIEHGEQLWALIADTRALYEQHIEDYMTDSHKRYDINRYLRALTQTKVINPVLNAPNKALTLAADSVMYRKELWDLFRALDRKDQLVLVTRALNAAPVWMGSSKMLSEAILWSQWISGKPVDLKTRWWKAHLYSGIIGVTWGALMLSSLYDIFLTTGEVNLDAKSTLTWLLWFLILKAGIPPHLVSLYDELKERPISIEKAAALYRDKYDQDPTLRISKMKKERDAFYKYRNQKIWLDSWQKLMSKEWFQAIWNIENKEWWSLLWDMAPLLSGFKQILQSVLQQDIPTKRKLSREVADIQWLAWASRLFAIFRWISTTVWWDEQWVDLGPAFESSLATFFWFLGHFLYLKQHAMQMKDMKNTKDKD